MFNINQAATQISHSSFRIVSKCFRYLGVEFSSLFVKKFDALFEKCKKDMKRWRNLPLSITGRFNLLKMIVLPKFLYLSQNLPILIKKSFHEAMKLFCISTLNSKQSSRQKDMSMHPFSIIPLH